MFYNATRLSRTEVTKCDTMLYHILKNYKYSLVDSLVDSR